MGDNNKWNHCLVNWINWMNNQFEFKAFWSGWDLTIELNAICFDCCYFMIVPYWSDVIQLIELIEIRTRFNTIPVSFNPSI